MSGRRFWIFRSGRLALPDVREWSGDPPGCLGVVGGPPGCLGVVWRHSRMFLRSGRSFQMSGSYCKASRMSGSGRETILDVRESLSDVRKLSGGLTDVQEWSGGPRECPGVVRRPSQMSKSGRKACRMSGSPSRMAGSIGKALLDVREALSDVREWSGGHPGCLGVVGRPFRMSGSGQEALPDVR